MKRSDSAATAAQPVKRCAIYTRKSTTMGLEQAFTTLDAQRDACTAFVQSQAHAGWVVIDEHYDDGGFTGANLDRPAFARLVTDIDAGKINIVVVYKFDRLSRSTIDFLQLVQRLTAAGVGLASVTEQVSSDGPMGRVMLKVIMGFAEFERETIAERTRDKMAAARRRGRWTGGPVPLGYRTENKCLVVDELEAVHVREIFNIYLEQRSALATAQLLNERGRTTKRHLAATGRLRQSRAWSKPDVLRVLKNPVYAGYMPYGKELHEGEHEAIIDRDTFEAVRALVASAGGAKGPRYRNPEYVLGGLLFCASCGSALTAASTNKGKREYRYYRCVKRDQHGRSACPTKPVSAPVIEEYVAERLRDALSESDLVGDLMGSVSARVANRGADLDVERRRLPGEIATLAAEGRRLVDKIGELGDGGRHLLERRLEEVGAELRRLERRLGEVEREIAALDAATVEAEWLARCLQEFGEVWDVLSAENRARLLRAVIERIEYEGPSGEVRLTLTDLRPNATVGEVA